MSPSNGSCISSDSPDPPADTRRQGDGSGAAWRDDAPPSGRSPFSPTRVSPPRAPQPPRQQRKGKGKRRHHDRRGREATVAVSATDGLVDRVPMRRITQLLRHECRDAPEQPQVEMGPGYWTSMASVAKAIGWRRPLSSIVLALQASWDDKRRICRFELRKVASGFEVRAVRGHTVDWTVPPGTITKADRSPPEATKAARG